jgi:hypothetical protein
MNLFYIFAAAQGRRAGPEGSRDARYPAWTVRAAPPGIRTFAFEY